MTRVRVDITVSADGYVAGPNPSLEHPLGEGGDGLHEWAFALRAFRQPHGMEGGEVNASTPVVEEALANVGAEIMARWSAAGPASSTSTWRRGSSTSSSCTSSRWCSAAAARLFDGLAPDLELEQARAIEAPGVTHLKYRVVN